MTIPSRRSSRSRSIWPPWRPPLPLGSPRPALRRALRPRPARLLLKVSRTSPVTCFWRPAANDRIIGVCSPITEVPARNVHDEDAAWPPHPAAQAAVMLDEVFEGSARQVLRALCGVLAVQQAG